MKKLPSFGAVSLFIGMTFIAMAAITLESCLGALRGRNTHHCTHNLYKRMRENAKTQTRKKQS
jgi:hypothetical protein